MKGNYYYDEITDDLMISNKAEKEKVRKNFMFDDFVISLSKKGKIVGIEITNISKLLDQSGIDPKILKNLKGAELIVQPKKNFIFIGINLNIIERKNLIYRKLPITHLPVAGVCN
jgi:uncharacterized protein YuzE